MVDTVDPLIPVFVPQVGVAQLAQKVCTYASLTLGNNILMLRILSANALHTMTTL